MNIKQLRPRNNFTYHDIPFRHYISEKIYNHFMTCINSTSAKPFNDIRSVFHHIFKTECILNISMFFDVFIYRINKYVTELRCENEMLKNQIDLVEYLLENQNGLIYDL